MQTHGLQLKIALIHDWLDTWGGAENVLVELRRTFADAPVYTLVDFLTARERALLGPGPIFPSTVQTWPGARANFRRYLPAFPAAVGRFDLSAYDVILSNSHAVAKFARARSDQLHICYCHTPMRYAWDLRERYLTESGLARGPVGVLSRVLLGRLRRQDVAANVGIQHFVGNSQYIAARIRRCYDREADVIYPPVDTARFVPGDSTDDYYVTVSRLVPYKQVDAIVQAFAQMPDRRLIVAGSGPKLAALRAEAPPNVDLRGHVPFNDLLPLMQRARAFLFAAEEDFGIAPLEAQACGLPVIALGRGGVAETVSAGDPPPRTGVFFGESTPSAIAAAVRRFEAGPPIASADCHRNASRFNAARFREQFRTYVDASWNKFQTAQHSVHTKDLAR